MPLSSADDWARAWQQAGEAVSAGGDHLAEWLGSSADIMGNLRYGMPTSEKERIASSGSLPGAPVDRSADQDVSNRYAAGYLFGQQYPNAAPMIQPYVDQLKTSDLPLFGGESPETQAYARYGVNQGSAKTLGEMIGPAQSPPTGMPPMPPPPVPPRR